MTGWVSASNAQLEACFRHSNDPRGEYDPDDPPPPAAEYEEEEERKESVPDRRSRSRSRSFSRMRDGRAYLPSSRQQQRSRSRSRHQERRYREPGPAAAAAAGYGYNHRAVPAAALPGGGGGYGPPNPEAVAAAEENHEDGGGAANEAIEEEQPDEPVIHKTCEIDFDKEYEQDPDDPILFPKFCVYCHVAQSPRELEMNKRLSSLLDLSKHHRAFMSPLRFCRMMQNEYNEKIRKHIVDKFGRPYKDPRGAPAMSAHNFWHHHLSHMYSPMVFHEELAREVSSNLLLMLHNGVKLKTRKRGVYVDGDKMWHVARIYDKFKGVLSNVNASRDATLFGAT